MKTIIYLCLFLGSVAYATDVNFALELTQQSLNNLKDFKPQTQIPGFTENPVEKTLYEHDGQKLSEKTNAIKQPTAEFIKEQEKIRVKDSLNGHRDEVNQAESILTKPTNEDSLCNTIDCNQAKAEESQDFNEGIVNLGVLAANAEEVTRGQIGTNDPRLFAGYYQECEKYPLGIRDCCTDSGFLEGLINCPSDLQNLQRAKVENRVFYLGHYKPHFYSATRHGHCVFPSRLAGIIQIQGRFGQLGIGFGVVKYHYCRGITPEELSRLDFGRLDLSSIGGEFSLRKGFPDSADVPRL